MMNRAMPEPPEMRILAEKHGKPEGYSRDIVAEFTRKIGDKILMILVQRHPVDRTWNRELHVFCYFFSKLLNYMETPGTVEKLSDAENARATELPPNPDKVRSQVVLIPYQEVRHLVPMGDGPRGNILYRVYYTVPQDEKIIVTGVKKLSYADPKAPDDNEERAYVDELTGKIFFGLRNLRWRNQGQRRPETISRPVRRSRSPVRSRSRRRSRSPERSRSRRRSRSRSPVKNHDPLEELRLRKECAEAEARKAMAEAQIHQFQPWPAPPPPVLPAPPLPEEPGQNFVYQTPPGYGNSTYWVDRSGTTH